VRHSTIIALLLAGSATGIPLGSLSPRRCRNCAWTSCCSNASTTFRKPANVQVRDDRWDPGAETGVHEHPGPVILAVIDGELVEETPVGPQYSSRGPGLLATRARNPQREECQ